MVNGLLLDGSLVVCRLQALQQQQHHSRSPRLQERMELLPDLAQALDLLHQQQQRGLPRVPTPSTWSGMVICSNLLLLLLQSREHEWAWPYHSGG
jgi:hypothetical protein